MKTLSVLSIKQKLVLVIMTTALSGLIVVGVAVGFYEWRVFRAEMVQTLSTLAAVTATNSTAALTFKDRKRAEETIGALGAEAYVALGCMYSKDGSFFAAYRRSGAQENCPRSPAPDGWRFDRQFLTLSAGIFLDRERIGTVMIRSELSGLDRRLALFLGVLSFLVSVVGVLSYLLSLRIQRLISRPILGLASVARRISECQNYSVRAQKQSADEVGLLVDAFNEMLYQIESREIHLTQVNEELRKSEEQFRATFEYAPTGKTQVDPTTGRFVRVNLKFCEITGYSAEELLSKSFRDITHPEDIQPDIAMFQRLVSGEIPIFDRIKRYVRKDGKTIWVHACSSLIRDKQGRPVITIGDFYDITRQKQAENERDQLLVRESEARSQAEHALRAREEFMSIAGHELRTPLTPLKLQLHVLKKILIDEKPVAAEARKDLISLFSASEQQMDRLSKLIDDLLDVSRISSGRLKLVLEQVDLSELIGQVLERYKVYFRQAGCTVEFHGEQKTTGWWDRLRIEQVIINLLMNAAKYGAGKPIVVTVAKEGDQAKVSVRDFGIGIAQEDQERIFERFERAVSVRHFGGFGLGLYLSRQIVLAHGGRIRVDSRIGIGSTFTLELPSKEASSEAKAG